MCIHIPDDVKVSSSDEVIGYDDFEGVSLVEDVYQKSVVCVLEGLSVDEYPDVILL